MDREARINLNRKQDYLSNIKSGQPDINSIQEGSFQLRYINNVVYIVAKKNGKLWYFKGSNTL